MYSMVYTEWTYNHCTKISRDGLQMVNFIMFSILMDGYEIFYLINVCIWSRKKFSEEPFNGGPGSY